MRFDFSDLKHYVKSVRIRSFSGLYFRAFGLNTARKTRNTDTFYVLTIFTTLLGTSQPRRLKTG